MPRPALLPAALVLTALPVLVAAPAHAATNVICVNRADDPECAVRPATLPVAIQVAATDGVDSVIRLGPGTYTDGPYALDGTTSPLTVQGANNGTGANATILQGGTSKPYVTAHNATVRNLRITLGGDGGEGLAIDGATASAVNVIVSDTPTTAATNATGIRATGTSLFNSTVNLARGAGNTGFVVETAVLTRVTSRTSGRGVVINKGSLAIDNSVIDLGATGSVGLRAGLAGGADDIAVDGRYLTVVGAGASGSRGVLAFADNGSRATQVTLANSIVRDQSHSLGAAASAGSAAVGVSYSDLQPNDQATGTGAVNRGDGILDVDPAFLKPGAEDYQLRSGSPVLDKGSALVTSGNDRNDEARAADGDGNGSPIPDMGAYELHDITPPRTTFSGGPSGPTKDNTPVFQFKSSEGGSSFECQLDGGAWQPCTSPVTTNPLPDGAHALSVRATDVFFNRETSPVTRSFVVDTAVPSTTITKKPPKRFAKKRVKFTFAASEAGARLQCNLDRRGWRSCHSPYRFNVKVGKHRLQVRAVDAAGNVDPTPAHYSYRRVKKQR